MTPSQLGVIGGGTQIGQEGPSWGSSGDGACLAGPYQPHSKLEAALRAETLSMHFLFMKQCAGSFLRVVLIHLMNM